MCGRFALAAPASAITEVFEVDVLPHILPRYNIAPTQQVACVVEEEGQRTMQTFRWGLIPSWAKDRKIAYRTINARAETVASKPSYRAAFRRRRLLILADGFYEWKREGKQKIPHLIQIDGGRPFGMAGIWEEWTDPESGELLRTCSLITTEPNEVMRPIHNRMPVILQAHDHSVWLDPQQQDRDLLQELLQPFPADRTAARLVSTRVNNARNEGPECQAPPEDPTD